MSVECAINHKDEEQKYISEQISMSSNTGSATSKGSPVSHIAATSLETERHNTPMNDGAIAWLQCLGAFSVWLCTWGLIGSYGVFQTYYQAQVLQHMSPSTIAWIGSTQSAITMFGAPIAGHVFDRGYFKFMIRTGSVLTVLGVMLTSICHAFWQLILTQGLVTGLGLACLFMPTVALLPTWFIRHRALAISLASSGVGIGGILFSVTFNQLLPRIGFGWTVRVISFILLAFLLLANLTMKQRLAAVSKPRRLFDMSAWKQRQYVTLATATFLAYLGLYIPFYYMQVYSTSAVRIPIKIVPYLIPILNAGFAVGRILPGLIADRIGVFNTLAPLLLIAGVIGFCWQAFRGESGLIAFSLLFGIFASPFQGLGPAAVVSITPDLSVFGVWMGMMFVPMGVGLLIGPPIGGAILRTNGWLGLQIFCGCTLSMAAFLVTCTRFLKTGWKLRIKF